MRFTLNELLTVVDAIVEQAGDLTIQEKWNKEKEALHEGIDEDDWNRVVNKEVDYSAEKIVSVIQRINLKSEEEA